MDDFSEAHQATILLRLPLSWLRVPGNIFRQELHGDEATEFRVLGLVDNTHPAAAKSLDDCG
jgi:hypothetical protein